MNVGQIFSCILIGFGAATIYMGISATRKKFREYLGNTILGLICFFSAVWSIGFAFVFLTDKPVIAYWGRAVGMIGVFGYLILAQFLVGLLVKIPRKAYYVFVAFALLGALIYVPTVLPSQTTFYMDTLGMTYVFKPGLINNIYTGYAGVYGVNMLISILMMVHYAKTKREKLTSYKMLITLLIVIGGMVMDTILPMLGLGAIPGSSLAQFLGVLVVYYGVVDYNQARITPMNMSQFVYTSVIEPILVFDTEGKLKLINASGQRVFAQTLAQRNREDISITDFFHLPEDFFGYEGESRTDETTSIVGAIPVEIQTNRIRDKFKDTIGFILTIKDMTQINQMMDSLVEEKKRADANSLAKSSFLANMSHEIRTPLNAIVGFSELLLKSDLNESDRDAAEDIRNSSYNLLAIINDILDISKIESGKMELSEQEYMMADVIRDAYLITQTLAVKKGLELSLQVDEKLPSKVYGDPTRVRGVLVNILNNAVKYTKTGSVRLEGTLMATEGDEAVLEFRVIDTGIGIRKEDMEILFDSFKQVDLKANTGIEGTGLGLAIVKGFLQLMKGDITVESEYGKGSTFIMTFRQRVIDATPIGAINLMGPAAKRGSAIGNSRFDGLRVLAVDDNKVNLKVISRTLAKYGMVITTVDSGPEAIEHCRNEEYDLVLMDQMMPGMDGVEAMKQIRALGGRYVPGGATMILALTANAISGVREELIGEGFDDYLSKPIEFGKMEEMFNGYVAAGRLPAAHTNA